MKKILKREIYLSIYRSTFIHSDRTESDIQYSMYIDNEFYCIDRDTWKLMRKRGIIAEFYYRVTYFPGTEDDSVEGGFFRGKKLITA